MSNSELNETLLKLSSISCCARGDKAIKLTSLAHHLNAVFLKDCYENLDRNKAVGVDKISWQEYGANLNSNLDDLVSRLKRKAFKPLPSK